MKVKEIENEYINPLVYRNLPELLKVITHNFNNREKDIVLLSSIGVLSSCLPNIMGYYDGDEVYAPLYVIIIAPPASGKGTMNYSRILIDAIHDKILQDSKSEIESCEQEKRKDKKRDFENCPSLEVKIIPANISTSEMYSFIASSNHGVIIIESEADTMGNMLKNDWGNYSDVLRKVFHHETISISRKLENLYIDIKEPKLSMVMSGTPDQLKPLIKSKDNGLFSRLIIYTFDEVSGFKNVFSKEARNYKTSFENVATEVFAMYEKLSEKQEPIEFQLTENQEKRLLKDFGEVYEIILEEHPNSFIPNLFRHGLVLFRICMIFTALRSKEFDNTLICSNRDFITALSIVKTMLKHALITHNNIEDGILSQSDEELLFGLNLIFTRKQIVSLGEKFGIPKRTIDDKLAQWRKKRAIQKVGHGKFKRVLK